MFHFELDLGNEPFQVATLAWPLWLEEWSCAQRVAFLGLMFGFEPRESKSIPSNALRFPAMCIFGNMLPRTMDICCRAWSDMSSECKAGLRFADSILSMLPIDIGRQESGSVRHC